jgi:hypothetical protein
MNSSARFSFDLRIANLMGGIQVGGRSTHLRTHFETLYDGGRPLRQALDQLQTLDTVRIIEGKP